MKDTIIKCIFLGVIAPLIIIAGLFYTTTYVTNKPFFNTTISEMNIEKGVSPPLQFYGVKWDNKKDDLLKHGLIVENKDEYSISYEIVLGKNEKPLFGDKGHIHFHNDKISGISFTDWHGYNGGVYTRFKDLLSKKYGTPHSEINFPSSFASLFEPSNEHKYLNIGSIINRWTISEYDIEITLIWEPDFDKSYLLDDGIIKKGSLILSYEKLSIRKEFEKESISKLNY